MTTQNKGEVQFDIGISDLSSNKNIYIHADCYSVGRYQKGLITIKEKNTTDIPYEIPFGPSRGKYVDMTDNYGFNLKEYTFYEVKVTITSSSTSGGPYEPSTICPVSHIKSGNLNEYLIASEDLEVPDDVNDTIVRLIWFSKP